MTTLSVDSIHINVSAGDSAIHLLIQTTGDKPDGGGPVNKDKPYVRNAILIDGGDNKHDAPNNVYKVIQQIPGSYEFPSGKTAFDSVILTHWDKDHYAGLAKLLNIDVEATVKNNPAITADQVQISFFKYGTTTDRTQPQTVFYCPNWDHAGANPKDNKNYLRGHSPDFDKTGTGPFYLTLNLKKGSNTGSIKKLPQIATVDWANLLGMEFFTRIKVDSSELPLCTSPTKLVQKHSLPKGVPGMYCVAVSGTFLTSHPSLPGVVNEHDSLTNASSISAMILWPPVQDDGLSKMSHYFSGDAEYVTEEAVVAWTGAGPANQYRVQNVKASHHGSATSFPTKMFTSFLPQNVIISAGASHGHPRWELMVYFWAYKMAGVSQGMKTPAEFYPTCYPYWFARNNTGEFILPNISPGEWDLVDTQYTKDFDLMWASIVGNVYVNPRLQYLASSFASKADKLQAIFTVCYEMWNYISRIRGHFYPPGSHAKKAVYYGTTQTALTPRQKIKCVRLRSSLDDDQTHITPILDDDAVATATTSATATATLDDWQNFPVLEWSFKLGPAAYEGSIVIPGQTDYPPDVDEEEGDPEPVHTDPESLGKRAKQIAPSHCVSAGIRAASIPSDGDYYCSQRTFVQGPNACSLSGDLDTFVSALHFGWLGVQAFPTSGGLAPVLDADEANQWLAKSFGITQLQVTGDNTTISTMQCLVPFASTNLVFATENVPWAFNLPNATAPTIPPTGPVAPILYASDMLILALGELPTAVGNIQLSDVCAFLGVEAPKFAGISLQLPLQLADTTNPGYRNALWFTPGKQYRTLLRLALEVTVTDDLNSLIFSKVGLAVDGAQVILRKSGSFVNIGGKPTLQSTSDIIFTTQVLIEGEDPTQAAAFVATLIYSFADGTTQIIVQCNADRSQWSRYLTWIEAKLGIPTGITDLLPVEKNWFPLPRRVNLTLGTNLTPTALALDFEVEAAFGQDTAFLFTFSWSPARKELLASLWPGRPSTSIPTSALTASMMPDYEDYQLFEPTNKTAQTTINLTDLIDSSAIFGSSLPNGILPIVTGLTLDLVQDISSGKGQTHVEFYASMTGSNTGTSKVPMISLDSAGLDLQYNFGTSAFDLALNFSVLLRSRDSAKYDPVILHGAINYNNAGSGNGTWQLEASVNGLMVGHLLSFFDAQSQNGVMDLIEAIEIQQIDVFYDYDSSGVGNHFKIDGILLLGPTQLTLAFEHSSSPQNKWDFTASLLTTGENETVSSVLQHISDDIQLPDFVGDIKLLSPDSGLELAIWTTNVTIGGEAVPFTVLQIDIKLGDFDLLFMQYTTAGWTRPKRIFRALVSGLSNDIPHIPVVDQLKQPYDELFFLYVQDKSGQAQSGILRQEQILLAGDPNQPITPAFLWKETVSEKFRKPTDTIYARGLHFDVVAIEKNGPVVVLDHVFSTNASTSLSEEVAIRDDASAMTANDASASGSDASMGAMSKKFGPLSISNIGIQYKNKHLLILLDATFALGPIALELLGFGLDLDLSQPGTSLKHLPIPMPTISGLGFGFNQPPLMIDGLFERVQTPGGSDLFLGGVVVAFEPYLFMAAGCYGMMVSGGDHYKTVALFALLEGPLVELEFAEIDGICGGFGYNSNVKFPTIDQVSSFPFIAKTGLPGTTPLDTINKLLNPTTGCINAQDGSIWLAAGMNVDAFKLLNVDAVVVVEFSSADVKLGIFADVIVIFPPDSEGFKMIYAELGLMVTVDFGAGVMLVQGQLAPTSFILDPSCHLFGGFGLAYWFGSNQHAGDWVFTVGGYHPQFQPPSYYPNVPRLGIAWSLDGSLNITGSSYFALTPKVCMGGGQLKASLSLDPLYAYFEAFADFLINFQPFYFIGDAGVDVGVRFTLDLWIVTIHINIDIGAELYIQGPPVHGYVHVDFWVFGFDIYFGDQQAQPTYVDLLGFWLLLKQQSQAAKALAGPGAENMLVPPGATPTPPPDPVDPTPGDDLQTGAHQISCVGGLITSASQDQKTPAAQPWNVRAGPFAFSIASPFVIGHVDIEEGASVDGSENDIWSRPMGPPLSAPLKSVVTVKVTHMAEGTASTVKNFRIQPVELSRVPGAMWAQYSASEDPLSTGGNFSNPTTTNTDLSATTISHLASLTIPAPPPYYPNATTEPITKFNVVAASSSDVLDPPPVVEVVGAASASWEPVIPTSESEWVDVPRLWDMPDWGVSAQRATVNTWVAAMGRAWEKGLAVDGGGGALVPDAPDLLVQGFEGWVMAAPLMTAVTA